MTQRLGIILLLAGLTVATECPAAAVRIGHSSSDKGFRLEPVPPPATNDAATAAGFKLIDGGRDGNGGDLAVLHDGRVPGQQDQPSANFFFRDGSDGGRIEVDFGKAISIASVRSYSWHPQARSPQVYNLYGAKGDEVGFNDSPTRGTDPATCGWSPVAKVDTRGKGGGGQVAVSVSKPQDSPLGEFRYLLFDVGSPDARDPQANTFFSEIDVLEVNGPASVPVPEKILKTYPSADGKYSYVVDATIAPDLTGWTETELMPVVREWYPKLVAILPGDNYTAPVRVLLEFRNDMAGTPAYAAGNKLSMNAPWFRTQLQGEARGCVIHEMAHIVQNYWRAAATNPHPSGTPGWVTEGIPDYIRWFLYEPQSKGAEITRGNFERSSYDASYRTTANFLNWVVETHDRDFIRKLNAAAREGRYSEKVWKDSTGKPAAELGAEWKEANAKRLGIR